MPQSIKLRELKAAALRAGADGCLILRGLAAAVLVHSFQGDAKTLSLTLDGAMLLIAVFRETDGGEPGVES